MQGEGKEKIPTAHDVTARKKCNLEKENESYASEKGLQVWTCFEEKGFKRSVSNIIWRKQNLRTKCLENPRF